PTCSRLRHRLNSACGVSPVGSEAVLVTFLHDVETGSAGMQWGQSCTCDFSTRRGIGVYKAWKSHKYSSDPTYATHKAWKSHKYGSDPTHDALLTRGGRGF